MADRPTTPLTRLRRRSWRVAALSLWVAVFVVNLLVSLAASSALAAQGAEADYQLICHAGAAPEQPAPPASHPDHDGPHCPLCHVVSATPLAAPAAAQLLLVLAPAPGWSGPVDVQAIPAAQPVVLPPSGPRAPPAFV